MSAAPGSHSFARPYRFRFRRSRSERSKEPDPRFWADVGADPSARMRRGFLKASDGIDVPYRFWLAREAHAAVLLLHGAFDYSAAFDEIGPKLARRGFSAIAIDQRGFGATNSRGTWAGAARMIEDAHETASFFLKRLPASLPLFVLGESMGGAIAVHAAAERGIPNLRGLVLAAPGALASAFRQYALTWCARVTRALAGDAEVVFERLSGWELTPAAAVRLIGDPLVMRRIRPDMLCGMVDLAFKSLERARMVDIPVLTMLGAQDEIIRQSCVRSLFDNFAGEKSWRVVPDAPHLLLHWRRSAEILREAAGWMSARLAGPC